MNDSRLRLISISVLEAMKFYVSIGLDSNEEQQPVQSPIALIDMSSSWTITSEFDFGIVSTVMLLTTVLPIVMQETPVLAAVKASSESFRLVLKRVQNLRVGLLIEVDGIDRYFSVMDDFSVHLALA